MGKQVIHSYISGVILITVVIISHQLQCFSIIDDLQAQKECDFDINSKHELIEPLVVIGDRRASNVSNAAKNLGGAEFHSVRLAEANVSCTDIMTIHFTAYGQRFVIDLVKNKRLISDRYFEISKEYNVFDRHDRHPDASINKVSSNKFGNNDDGEFHKNHLFLNLHNFTSNNDHCHYHGLVNDKPDSISALSIVENKLLSGFINDGDNVFHLHANPSNSSTVLTKLNDACVNKQRNLKVTKTISEQSEHSKVNLIKLHEIHQSQIKQRSRRDVKGRRSTASATDNYVRHPPFGSNSSSLYVEMLVVHDHSQYLEYNRNTSNIAERTMQIVNIMNAYYRQLNIFVALVGVVLWVEKDEIQLTDDGDSTLTNFLKYRYEKLLPKYHHDNAQLITSTSFNGSVVGKALKGPICTHEHSGGVNTDHSHSPAIVAVTLAHELGHNFGMEHDEDDKCKCPDEKCIMSASSSTVHPKHWSSCSIEYLEESRRHGLLDCLANSPAKVFGPVCGNGFVEAGEDCDPGESIPTYGTSKSRKTGPRCTRPGDCEPVVANPCCDRQTCKFVGNATCAQGPCCDLTKCSVYNNSEPKICRGRQTECDLEEVCDGKNEFCPPDVYYHDGIECGSTAISLSDDNLSSGSTNQDRSRAYCYKGKCNSHLSQCQLLWGASGFVSKDICYEQNVHGNRTGNCGKNNYNGRDDDMFHSCESEDAICGMLHCVHNQLNAGESRRTGKLGYGFESASTLTVSFFIMSNHTKIYCNGAIIDAGPGIQDPGMVPNGAACGEHRMCMDQKCVPVNDVLRKDWCPSDCNGNGICDNTGVCHCVDGSVGTSCYQFFGPNFHLSLFLYIVFFFVPIIGLMVFTINHYKDQLKIWWFLHRRMVVLRNKARDPNYNKRCGMAYDANKHRISICEPMPLNRPNDNSSTNKSLPDPVSDPWAETTNFGLEMGKSPGYRLEPLNKKQLAPSTMTAANELSRNGAGPEASNPKPGKCFLFSSVSNSELSSL